MSASPGHLRQATASLAGARSAEAGPSASPVSSVGVAALDESRSDASPGPRNAGLLQQGDTLFASGSYQAAIHVWTRILFFERGNADARQRIERAQALIAERERRLDLLLAEAGRLLAAGAVDEARKLVRSVLALDASHGEAMNLQSRLDALDRRAEPSPLPEQGDRSEAASPVPSRGVVFRVPRTKTAASPRAELPPSPLRMGAFFLGCAILIGLAAVFLHENWDVLVSDGAFGEPADVDSVLSPARESDRVPDVSELRYYNGVRCFTEGRYREALFELGRVDSSSPVAADARRLILRIEERLLRGASAPESPTR